MRRQRSFPPPIEPELFIEGVARSQRLLSMGQGEAEQFERWIVGAGIPGYHFERWRDNWAERMLASVFLSDGIITDEGVAIDREALTSALAGALIWGFAAGLEVGREEADETEG